ncbi:MAG: hypothetical protein N4J56_007152 [Chroococcidiopsis sp. SAG 2025]|uniref:ribbon-helix-helix protein, CopG family n=1 Tax=Chroococcidiopsis sp. SAG 2025 TaxID=171389 RepID=UPI000691BC98|nr:hypothetical protein [Chroococcidiopsis sp. SAG 2025]OWY63859.1 ribbon-helix-helix protein, CopG family [cyanobacterium TDX16]PSB46865.1 ribbon-helix-helix protein, CopG family [Cyanosarcina cf. burmensis CCALA 770]
MYVYGYRAMSRDKYASPGKWGESKKRFNIMLTPSLVEQIDRLASEMNVTRSEYIELLFRKEILDEVKAS